MQEHHLDLFYGVIIPYINLALFLGMFFFFFRKALANYAKSRRDGYLSNAEAAAKRLNDSKKVFDEIKTRYNSIDAELSSFKKQSEDFAKQDAAKIAAEGEKLAEQIVRETNRVALEEIERAKRELRSEIVAEAKKQAESELRGLTPESKNQIFAKRLESVTH